MQQPDYFTLRGDIFRIDSVLSCRRSTTASKGKDGIDREYVITFKSGTLSHDDKYRTVWASADECQLLRELLTERCLKGGMNANT